MKLMVFIQNDETDKNSETFNSFYLKITENRINFPNHLLMY